MKEVLAPIARGNKTKAFVGQPFDCAVHRRHRCLAQITVS
jgi:hypothetical protein